MNLGDLSTYNDYIFHTLDLCTTAIVYLSFTIALVIITPYLLLITGDLLVYALRIASDGIENLKYQSIQHVDNPAATPTTPTTTPSSSMDGDESKGFASGVDLNHRQSTITTTTAEIAH